MCGIFGICIRDGRDIANIVIDALYQLQNRGYDSAGISILNNNKFSINKYASTGKEDALSILKKIDYSVTGESQIAMGHNRWATHGIKNNINAHPHISNSGQFCIVHNGIIENYGELKQMLIKEGFSFYSQTDTEVIVNLIEYNYSIKKNVLASIKKTIESLRGTYGLVIQTLYETNTLYCVRNGSPLLLGITEDYCIVTSEQSGFCNMVKSYITLHNDDICKIIIDSSKNISFSTDTHFNYTRNNTNNIEFSKYPYSHWTLKEIYEQPTTIQCAINNGGRIKNSQEVKLGGLEQHLDILKSIENIILLGCGTSYFAGQYGAYHLKKLCNFNTVQVFDGAEFTENDIPKIGNTAFILISQSGETKDLHRCIDIAKRNNITTIGVINVVDSLIAREVDCGVYCNAGREIGVASTKSFISQVVCISLIAIWFSGIRDINRKIREKYVSDLQNLSNDIQITLESVREDIEKLSQEIDSKNMFLLGKGSDEYIAKEGSLKIKEISYIHSEGYSSSSLKHGPFALLDKHFPVILLNLDQVHYSKTLNCYEEIASRDAPIYIISNNKQLKTHLKGANIVIVPENYSYCSLLGMIPIQLLAYYLSIRNGINPDIPKNLAKVVTVE
jgi:glucosamine--fructose-6-phosphate aminotransferase (isomerizing)